MHNIGQIEYSSSTIPVDIYHLHVHSKDNILFKNKPALIDNKRHLLWRFPHFT